MLISCLFLYIQKIYYNFVCFQKMTLFNLLTSLTTINEKILIFSITLACSNSDCSSYHTKPGTTGCCLIFEQAPSW